MPLAQLAVVLWAFAFAAGRWPLKVLLAAMMVDLVLLPIHQAGMARLRRAGLARVDVDGVRLEGRPSVRSGHAAPR